MALLTLPGRHEVQHVHALVGLAVLLALLAAELDGARDEERAAGGRVLHLDEAGVEVDLGRERRDRDEGRGPDAEDGRDGLVEEALVAVRGLFENEDVAAGALGRADLREKKRSSKYSQFVLKNACGSYIRVGERSQYRI